MHKLTLKKDRSRPTSRESVATIISRDSKTNLRSAVWQIEELPGLFILGSRMLSPDCNTESKIFWTVKYHAVVWGHRQQEISRRVEEKLSGQRFVSRRDAVCAIQSALLYDS